MEPLTCWIGNEDRVETLKSEFENYYSYEGAVNPLIVTKEPNGGFKIEIDPRGLDLLLFFHAGIQYELDQRKKFS